LARLQRDTIAVFNPKNMGGYKFMSSRKEIITSIDGFRNAPLGLYQFPSEVGSFVGTLMYRAWHPKKRCLMCMFDTDDGEHLVLYGWWNNLYGAKKSRISFADDVYNGSRWKCEYDRAKGGSITWQTSELLDD
jgi:hypothetical protein